MFYDIVTIFRILSASEKLGGLIVKFAAVVAIVIIIVVLAVSAAKKSKVRNSEGNMFCKRCGAQLSEFSQVCEKCGAVVNEDAAFCQKCGAQMPVGAFYCPRCGSAVNQGRNGQAFRQQKSKIAAGLFGIFLGWLGIHNFYLGYKGKAIAQLLISILSFGVLLWVSALWGLIEGIVILAGSNSCDANGVPLRD